MEPGVEPPTEQRERERKRAPAGALDEHVLLLGFSETAEVGAATVSSIGLKPLSMEKEDDKEDIERFSPLFRA